jgi:Ca2+-dependent lipid-binding protein
MEIFDKDTVKDDLVGTALLNVEDLTKKGGVKDWFEIFFKGKLGGLFRGK